MATGKYCASFFLLLSFIAIAQSDIVRKIFPEEYTEDELTADIPELGKIIGRGVTTIGDRKEYIQFLGMPYAQFTGGVNRFLPSELREGRLNETGGNFTASSYGLPCLQQDGLLPVADSEDCLFINVFTPKVCKTQNCEKLPVIFFIHGGAFTIGSGNLFAGSRILNRDVVYVTFNYRLGVLGFYCLQTENAPGNAGLYDMITALKWTNKYISYFGGDPDLVTIAGQSSGSVGVTNLLLSPLARGLFHRAIANSGSVLNDWGHTKNPLGPALKISQMAGCYTPVDVLPDLEALNRITDCMRQINGSILVDVLLHYQVAERLEGRLGFDPVSPSVQSFPLVNSPRFLPDEPLNILLREQQANVPLLMGTTLHDGSYVAGVLFNRFLTPNDHFTNTDFMKYELVPAIMKCLAIHDDSYGVYESLQIAYLGETRHTGQFDAIVNGIIDIASAFFFKAAAYRTAELHSTKNDTFWYSFDYKGSQTLWQFLFGFVETPPFYGGITHTDELIYLHPLTMASFNAEETAVSNQILDYWYNFAKYGDPTYRQTGASKWPSLSGRSRKFMSIRPTPVVLDDYPNTWTNTFDRMLPASSTHEIRNMTLADVNPELLKWAF